MKKYIALSLILMTVVCCFTACSDKKKKLQVKGGEVLTNYGGDEYALPTEEDGGIVRDEDGDIVLLVTNENGKVEKDKDGNALTEKADLEYALVVEGLIEFNDYYMEIPDGWDNFYSYTDLIIKKNNSEDMIKIMKSDKDVTEKQNEVDRMLSVSNETFPDGVREQHAVNVGELSGPLYSIYIPKAANGKPFYLGYLIIENGDDLYTFQLSSENDLSKDLGEIEKILSSVKFK